MNIDTNWHSWNEEMLLAHFKTDAARGLSSKESAKRHAKNGSNRIWKVKRASAGQFAVQTLLDLATVLLIVFAVIAAIFEKSGELFAILGAVLAGAGLRVFTYISAQRIFEEKARGVIPRVRVIRSGEVKIVNAEKLVTGDVVFLETGDTVPADIRVLSSSGLLVYENRITENKSVIFKNSDVISEDANEETPIEKRENMLYAGTTVVSGEARGIVVATGQKTLAATKFGTLLIPSGEKIKLVGRLSRLCRLLSLIMIGIVAAVTVAGALLRTASAVELLLSTLALAVASMSEFLAVLGSIVIAVSVKKADAEECGRAKIKDASSVEVMNDVDTIVIESAEMLKAGDITLNSYYLYDRIVNVDEHIDGYSPSELLKMCYLTTGSLPQGALSGGMLISERQSTSVDYEGIRRVYDGYFKKSWESGAVENTVIVGHEVAGSAESGGLDTVLVCAGGNFEAIASGPLELILPCCTGIRKNGKVLPMTREDLASINAEAERLKKRGIYTVGVSRRDSPYTNMNRVSALQMCMTFEGFLALSDRVHGDALDVIRKCREGSVRIVCFTEGSHEDKAFLGLVGILEENDRYISLGEVNSKDSISLKPGQFAVIETGYSDAPRRRREILKKLSAGGCRVSYISKDPSDMWAMKEVPVSFAVPEAAKIKKTIPQSIRSAAHVVITPSKNGGGIFEAFRTLELAKGSMLNLRRAADYLAASQTARLIYLLASAFSPLAVADPIHLLLWGLIFDFFCVMVIAYRDPPYNMVALPEKRKKIPESGRDFLAPAAIGALWALGLLVIPVVFTCLSSVGALSVGNGECANLFFTSAVLSIPVVSGEMMTRSSIFKRSKRRSVAIPLSFALSLVLSLAFAFSASVSSYLGCEKLTLAHYAMAYIPSVCALCAFEIKKAVSNGRTKKRN